MKALLAFAVARWQLKKVSGVDVSLDIKLNKAAVTTFMGCTRGDGIYRWIQLHLMLTTHNAGRIKEFDALEDALRQYRVSCIDLSPKTATT